MMLVLITALAFMGGFAMGLAPIRASQRALVATPFRPRVMAAIALIVVTLVIVAAAVPNR